MASREGVCLGCQQAFQSGERGPVGSWCSACKGGPLDRRDEWLRGNYGIGLSEYQTLLAAQNGHCVGCERTGEDNGLPLAVDHDHISGKVRGLLCFRCNSTVGLAGDQPAVLRRLASYLETNLPF